MPVNSILLLTSFVIPVLMLFIYPSLTKAIFNDLRFVRILHYIALALLGFALYFSNHYVEIYFSNPGEWLIFLLFFIALTYAAVFAIVTNNIADFETDKISNTERPLVQGTVKQLPYLLSGIFCLAYAIVLSLLVHRIMFYCIAIISMVYFIYSCRPFRLKRIPILAKLLIGFNSLVVAVCGFILAGGSLLQFPVVWAIFILLPLSLAANFVDLKDTAGDGTMGVKTLPVIFGQKKAVHLISFFTFCTYAMAAIILHILWVYPLCAVMAALHIALLYRKPYKEAPVFLIYISALFGLAIILLLNKYLS